MIVLLSGASHTGKTVLAQKLLERYQYPYLSIDHLKMGLIRSGNTELTPLSADSELTEYLWPIVCEIIKTAIENKQNLIVEGCFGWIDSTTKKMDNGVTAQRFAPRRKGSLWSELNKERCRRMERLGRMTMGLIRSGNTELTPLSTDSELTEYLWPIVCEIIKTAIENKQNLIVEGCYIPFDWKKNSHRK